MQKINILNPIRDKSLKTLGLKNSKKYQYVNDVQNKKNKFKHQRVRTDQLSSTFTINNINNLNIKTQSSAITTGPQISTIQTYINPDSHKIYNHNNKSQGKLHSLSVKSKINSQKNLNRKINPSSNHDYLLSMKDKLNKKKRQLKNQKIDEKIINIQQTIHHIQRQITNPQNLNIQTIQIYNNSLKKLLQPYSQYPKEIYHLIGFYHNFTNHLLKIIGTQRLGNSDIKQEKDITKITKKFTQLSDKNLLYSKVLNSLRKKGIDVESIAAQQINSIGIFEDNSVDQD